MLDAVVQFMLHAVVSFAESMDFGAKYSLVSPRVFLATQLASKLKQTIRRLNRSLTGVLRGSGSRPCANQTSP